MSSKRGSTAEPHAGGMRRRRRRKSIHAGAAPAMAVVSNIPILWQQQHQGTRARAAALCYSGPRPPWGTCPVPAALAQRVCDQQDTICPCPGTGGMHIHPAGNAGCPAEQGGSTGHQQGGHFILGLYCPGVTVCPEAAQDGVPRHWAQLRGKDGLMRSLGLFPRVSWGLGIRLAKDCDVVSVFDQGCALTLGSAQGPRLISKQRSGVLCTWGEQVGMGRTWDK